MMSVADEVPVTPRARRRCWPKSGDRCGDDTAGRVTQGTRKRSGAYVLPIPSSVVKLLVGTSSTPCSSTRLLLGTACVRGKGVPTPPHRCVLRRTDGCAAASLPRRGFTKGRAPLPHPTPPRRPPAPARGLGAACQGGGLAGPRFRAWRVPTMCFPRAQARATPRHIDATLPKMCC